MQGIFKSGGRTAMRSVKFLSLCAVLITLFACGDNGSTTTATPGINNINLQGGKAFRNVSSAGGNGGGIAIDSYANVKITSTGSVSTLFTVPTATTSSTPKFGATSQTVKSSTTVKLSTDPLAVGDLFVNLDGDKRLHRVTATGEGIESVVVSGLTVASGATLTLPVNVSASNQAALIFDDSVEIDGTVAVKTSGTGIYLEAGNAEASESLLRVGSSGKVGTSGSGTAGGSIYLFSRGMLINEGTLDASGGAGAAAGYVEMESYSFLYNTGKVTAKGGTATEGTGGNGGPIGMMSFSAGLYNSGALNNSGGDGPAGGGDGGTIFVTTGANNSISNSDIPTSMGRTVVGGSLTSNGGNATLAGAGGRGAAVTNPLFPAGVLDVLQGPKPGIFLESNKSGSLLVSAVITSTGGAAGGGAFTGGSGGSLGLFQGFGSDQASGNNAGIEGIKLGSIIDLSGGTAGLTSSSSSARLTGGNGGSIYIRNDVAPDAYPPSTSGSNTNAGFPPIELVGYRGINLSGGAAGYGGNAGNFRIYTYSPQLANIVFPVPAIDSGAMISAKGGDGNLKTGFGYSGGAGGGIDWRVGGTGGESQNAYQEKVSTLTSKGIINISGGEGDTGGNGGALYLYGYVVNSSSAITANGGKGTTRGGESVGTVTESNEIVLNGIQMHSTLNLTNSGVIAANGGSGVTGGNGGSLVTLTAGRKVTNSGAISANGGDGTATNSGGSGGTIKLFSQSGSTSNSAVLTANKGKNGVEDGTIIVY